MEEMVEAAVYLCDCDAETTGQVFVSLDLIADRGRHRHDPRRRRRRGAVLRAPGSVRAHDRHRATG